MAVLLFSYALWLVGGFLGLHHLYLKRYCHAFTWLVTGGGLGLGWMWDMCELPNYVEEASNLADYIRDYSSGRRRPRCTMTRFIGQLITGYWLGELALLALPLFVWDSSFGCLFGSMAVSLGIAWGVYVVGNIGLQERPFRDAVVWAWPLSFCFLLVGGSQSSIAFAVISSAVGCNRCVRWRTRPPPFTLKIVCLWTVLYCTLWLAMLSYNVRISVNGKVVTLGSAIWETTSSSEWSSESWSEFREYMSTNSWEKVVEDFQEFINHFASTRTFISPNDVEKAYEDIGLGRSASQHDIKSRCRRLMRDHHPDRTKDGNSEQFLKIQRACEILNPRSSSFRNNRDDL